MSPDTETTLLIVALLALTVGARRARNALRARRRARTRAPRWRPTAARATESAALVLIDTEGTTRRVLLEGTAPTRGAADAERIAARQRALDTLLAAGPAEAREYADAPNAIPRVVIANAAGDWAERLVAAGHLSAQRHREGLAPTLRLQIAELRARTRATTS